MKNSKRKINFSLFLMAYLFLSFSCAKNNKAKMKVPKNETPKNANENRTQDELQNPKNFFFVDSELMASSVLAGFLYKDSSKDFLGPPCNLLKLSRSIFATTKVCFDSHLNSSLQEMGVAELNSSGILNRKNLKDIVKWEEKSYNPYVLVHTIDPEIKENQIGQNSSQLLFSSYFSEKNLLPLAHPIELVLLGLPTFNFDDMQATKNKAELVVEEYMPLKRNELPDEMQKERFPGLTALAKGIGKQIHTLRKSGLVFVQTESGSVEFAGMADFVHWKKMYEIEKEVKYPILHWQHLCEFESLENKPDVVPCRK